MPYALTEILGVLAEERCQICEPNAILTGLTRDITCNYSEHYVQVRGSLPESVVEGEIGGAHCINVFLK